MDDYNAHLEEAKRLNLARWRPDITPGKIYRMDAESAESLNVGVNVWNLMRAINYGVILACEPE